MRLGPYYKILTAAALWSTIGVAASYGKDPLWIAFTRSLTASATALLIARRIHRAGLAPGLLLGGLFAVYPVAAITAGVGPAAYLLYTAPLWTTTYLSLKGERPTRGEVAGVALVLIAVLLLTAATASRELSPAGLAAGLASSVFYGLYIAVARKLSSAGQTEAASLGAMPYTLIVTTPLLLLSKKPPVEALAAGLYLGIFGTIMPYMLFASAVSVVRGAKASVLASLEPVLAAIWGALLFGQIPGPLTLASYALITAAALISTRH